MTWLCVCVFLSPAEVASILIRSVSYEGPALRKQVSKAQQLQQELSRRELECQSGATDMRERYYAACKQYGIQVRQQIIQFYFASFDADYPYWPIIFHRVKMWQGSYKHSLRICL